MYSTIIKGTVPDHVYMSECINRTLNRHVLNLDGTAASGAAGYPFVIEHGIRYGVTSPESIAYYIIDSTREKRWMGQGIDDVHPGVSYFAKQIAAGNARDIAGTPIKPLTPYAKSSSGFTAEKPRGNPIVVVISSGHARTTFSLVIDREDIIETEGLEVIAQFPEGAVYRGTPEFKTRKLADVTIYLDSTPTEPIGRIDPAHFLTYYSGKRTKHTVFYRITERDIIMGRAENFTVAPAVKEEDDGPIPLEDHCHECLGLLWDECYLFADPIENPAGSAIKVCPVCAHTSPTYYDYASIYRVPVNITRKEAIRSSAANDATKKVLLAWHKHARVVYGSRDNHRAIIVGDIVFMDKDLMYTSFLNNPEFEGKKFGKLKIVDRD